MRLLPLGDTTLMTVYQRSFIIQIILTEQLMRCVIANDDVGHLKAIHQSYKKESMIPWSEIAPYTSEYRDPDLPIDRVMQETWQQRKGHFQIDFKLLERIYKAMSDKSSVIRIDYTDNDRVIITNEHGDLGFLACFHS